MTTGNVAERLYSNSSADDTSSLQFCAEVTDIRLDSHTVTEDGAPGHLWQVALDRTGFYPAGGGQPCDLGVFVATAKSGASLEVQVERVEEDEAGEIWHYVRKPLTAGTQIAARVDTDRRMDHAQQHTGQHLLSAVFWSELKARTVSFHLSPSGSATESVTIDLALGPGQERLSDDELRRVEEIANRLIYADRPVTASWITREEAEAMLLAGNLMKLPERTGPMRIIEISGVEFNACGGTHVRSTGAIGGLLIRRVEKVRQGWRVEFCCGLRAVRAAGRDFARLSEVSKVLSVGPTDLALRVQGLIEDKKAAAKELKLLKRQLSQASPS